MSVPASRPEPRQLPAGSIEEWGQRRPAPRGRGGAEIRLSLDAIVRLAHCEDRRIEALAKGGYFAARWISGQSAVGPATGIDRPTPNLLEIGAEIEAAGRAAAGVQSFPNASYCDEGRIAARGVEEWLAWTFLPDYRLPMWLVPEMPLDEIRLWVLGRVGLGSPGLLGPGVSPERFPYDVADFVDAML